MYGREIEGQELTFGVSGKLIMNALVMFDRQTNSLWSQFISQAVKGELKGTKLEIFPSLLITWSEWLELHPETVALQKGQGSSYDPYDTYYRGGQAGVIGETVRDSRLHPKAFVVGLDVEGLTRAYSYSALVDTPIINDLINGLPIAVLLDENSSATVVYDRQVAGHTLTFSPLEREEGTPLKIRDQETGTTWTALTGEAIEGELLGTTLQRVDSLLTFWFAWTDFHPETELYGQ